METRPASSLTPTCVAGVEAFDRTQRPTDSFMPRFSRVTAPVGGRFAGHRDEDRHPRAGLRPRGARTPT